MPAPARQLLLGQLGFFACLSVCVAIDRAGLNDNHGWSYYGGRSETFLPYMLGFLVLILLLGRSARLLELAGATLRLAGALRLLALLLLLDLATPDTVNGFFYWAHNVASTLLFLFEFCLGIVLVATVVPSHFGAALFAVQLAGGLIAMFSQLQVLPILGIGIFLFQASFGALLVVATARVARAAQPGPLTMPGETPAAVAAGL
jgi:hypothetical protein